MNGATSVEEGTCTQYLTYILFFILKLLLQQLLPLLSPCVFLLSVHETNAYPTSYLQRIQMHVMHVVALVFLLNWKHPHDR